MDFWEAYVSNSHMSAATDAEQNTSPLVNRSRINCAVAIASALVAIIFLIIPIVVLYFISYPIARLGALSAFIILFPTTLATFTTARRHEIFVATATYAAVLVVFVSGNLSPNWNTNNYFGDTGVNPQQANAFATPTITVFSTETVASITRTAITTTTATLTLDVVQTVFPTTCAAPSPCATSATTSRKGGFNGLPTSAKAGIGIGIACAAALVLLFLSMLFVGACGCAMSIIAKVNRWRLSWTKPPQPQSDHP